MNLEELKGSLREVFNKYNVAGLPIDKDDNYDEYDVEINVLFDNMSNIRGRNEIKNLLREIFERFFWKGIIEEEVIFSKFSNEVFKILMDNEALPKAL